jgi:hypothetical protein
VSLAPQQVLRSDYINQILRALREATSVVSGLAVEPTSPPSMNIIVRAGTAVINGSVVTLARDVTVAVPAADPSNPRFDLVTLKSNGTVGYYTGTPEPPVCLDVSRPETCVKPTPPRTPAGEVALAEVWVPAGATAVDKIIDRRVVIGLAALQLSRAIVIDAEANIPLPGIKNRLFISSDTRKIFYDTGLAWVLVGELGGLSLPSHAARHEKGGPDPIKVLGSITVDTISSTLLPPDTVFILAEPVDANPGNELRNSPSIVLRGKYWTGAASANLDAEIKHVMLSKAYSKLSFIFAGAEKAYIDNAGNLSIAGSATISGNVTVGGTLSVGDVEFRNGWRIVENERYGLVLVSPSGRKYRFVLEEVSE